jgi:hypothetical protein
MKTELFSVCDFASTENGGKLNVVGVFDTLFAKQLPIIHPFCSIAARIRFRADEIGQKEFLITITDAEGNALFPDAKIDVTVKAPEYGDSSTAQIIATLGGLKFEKHAKYLVKLLNDGQCLAEAPLFVRPPAN